MSFSLQGSNGAYLSRSFHNVAQEGSLAPTGRNHGYTRPLSFCAGLCRPTPCPKISSSSSWVRHLFVLDEAAGRTGLVTEALLLLPLWVLKLLRAPWRQKPHFLGYFPISFPPLLLFVLLLSTLCTAVQPEGMRASVSPPKNLPCPRAVCWWMQSVLQAGTGESQRWTGAAGLGKCSLQPQGSLRLLAEICL